MARGATRFGSSTIALTVVAALLAVGAPAAHAAATRSARSGKALVDGLIAVEGPLTGPQASTGTDMADGAQLAVDQIDAAGGIDGVHLSLLKLNDKATASGGVAAAHKAIASRAFAVVGPFNSNVGVKNLSLYRKAGLPIVRLTSSVKTEGYGVTTQPMDSQVALVEVKEIT